MYHKIWDGKKRNVHISIHTNINHYGLQTFATSVFRKYIWVLENINIFFVLVYICLYSAFEIYLLCILRGYCFAINVRWQSNNKSSRSQYQYKKLMMQNFETEISKSIVSHIICYTYNFLCKLCAESDNMGALHCRNVPKDSSPQKWINDILQATSLRMNLSWSLILFISYCLYYHIFDWCSAIWYW